MFVISISSANENISIRKLGKLPYKPFDPKHEHLNKRYHTYLSGDAGVYVRACPLDIEPTGLYLSEPRSSAMGLGMILISDESDVCEFRLWWYALSN